MEDKIKPGVGRRVFLRTGVVAGATAVLAGCTGDGGDGGDGSTPTTSAGVSTATETETPGETSGEAGTPEGTETAESTETPEETPERVVEFEDDFEDGDYTSDPAWEVPELPEGAEKPAAEVVRESAPGSGSRAVRLTDVTDDRYQSPSVFSLADPMTGMDGEWTLSGLFSPVEFPDSVDNRYVVVSLYWPHDGNFGNRAWLQFRLNQMDADAESPAVRLRTQEQSNREWMIPDEEAVSPLATDQWYRWELVHEGEGSYTARRWPASGEQADGTELSTEFAAPDASVTFELRTFTAVTNDNGSSAGEAGEKPYTVDHDHVRRTSTQ